MPLLLIAGRNEASQLIPALAALAFAVTGRVLTARRPHNLVGWIVALTGLVIALAAVANGYVDKAPADPLVALQVSGLLTLLVWSQWLPALLAVALPLVFPDGRLPSPRWRWIAWAAAAGALLATLDTLFAPGPMDLSTSRHIENPLGISATKDLLSGLDDVLGNVLLGIAFLGAVSAVVVRLRRSRGVERQQLKWFAYVAVVMIAGLAVASFLSVAFDQDSGAVQVLGPIAWFTALAAMGFGIPAATGVAVMRYRLYEIDVVIRRTLVYATLTAALAAAYVASVLLLQLALGRVTSGSSLAVAVSTLAVAALFQPLRTRIQAVVDRRFYRHSYDAARTLEQFSARLREQVDLDALGGELRGVVTETMQPAHVSLWLRRAER
jgi:hypothetical protein